MLKSKRCVLVIIAVVYLVFLIMISYKPVVNIKLCEQYDSVVSGILVDKGENKDHWGNSYYYPIYEFYIDGARYTTVSFLRYSSAENIPDNCNIKYISADMNIFLVDNINLNTVVRNWLFELVCVSIIYWLVISKYYDLYRR